MKDSLLTTRTNHGINWKSSAKYLSLRENRVILKFPYESESLQFITKKEISCSARQTIFLSIKHTLTNLKKRNHTMSAVRP